MRLFSCCLMICFQLALIDSFSFKLKSFNYIDLSENNPNKTVTVFKYPYVSEHYEKFRLVDIGKEKNYLIVGARNRLLTVNLNQNNDIQITATNWPTIGGLANKNCSNRFCANYVLAALPINQKENNLLLCGTYFGNSKCIQTKYDSDHGYFKSFDSNTIKNAPKFVSLPPNSENSYYLTNTDSDSEKVLFTASSWTDNTQYLAAYSSLNNYQTAKPFKMIGKSKSFVKFAETSDKLFLFQNEDSYDVDDGETSRDILISTSLVSQICKNDNGASNSIEKDIFYSELTAKIYCFKEMFRSDSGNSENFKFDSLKFITDFVNIETANRTRKLFYGVFNTPNNQITASAICFFDINDIMNVFQKQNFKYLDEKNRKNQLAKDSALDPQACPRLTESEKIEYRAFTSKLSYMTRAAFPIKKRKASFLITNDYRITCLLVADSALSGQPAVKKLAEYDYLNIIYAGTDNGKVLRIAHYFTKNYFENDNPLEERVELLEEIQLFNADSSINNIEIIKNEKLIAISSNQIRAISIDFCQMYSDSCEQCVKQNDNQHYSTKCFWTNNECVSELSLNSNQNLYSNLDHCTNLKLNELFRLQETTTTTASIHSTTTSMPISLSSSQPKIIASDIFFSESSQTQNKPLVLSDFNFDSDNFKSSDTNNNNDEFKKTNLIIIGVVSLVITLIFGIFLGCILKTNYSQKLSARIFQLVNMVKKPMERPPSQTSQLSSSNELSKIRFARSTNDLCDKSSVTNSHSTSNDDDSFGSSQKSNCTYVYTSNSCSKAHLRNDLRNNKNLNYFTVNNEYALFPKTCSQNITTIPDYNKLVGSQTTTDVSNLTNETRLSSTSSSVDSSSYAIINNLINSQTCLLNAASKQEPLNTQLKSINEQCESPRYTQVKPKEKLCKTYSFSSSSTPTTCSYSPSATAAAVIESTYTTLCSNRMDRYKKHHHLRKKSFNVYHKDISSASSGASAIVVSQSQTSPSQTELPLKLDDTTIYITNPILNDALYLNNSYV